MGRPKKNRDLEASIEVEAGLALEQGDVLVTTQGEELEVESVNKDNSAKVKKVEKNEMPDDYTLDVIADYDPGADIFRIPNKDPRYAYRFLRSEEKNLSIKTGQLLFQKGGWQIVPKSHLLKIGIKESFIAPDGSYRMGEHILAFMPKELFDKKEAAKLDKTQMRTNQITRLLKEGDPSVGGKEMHKSMKGIQPAHKLGMGSKQED